jgi:putative ABC transport system permease protein
MFSFPLTRGHAETILREPLTMVITEEFRKKIFGDEDPLYKTLTLPHRGKSLDFTVTGVIEDVPKNTHLQFDFLLSMIRGKMLDGETHYDREWRSWDAFVYVELTENADPLEFSEKLAAHYEKHSGRQMTDSFILQPVKSIHLRSDAFIEISENYKMSNIYMFSCIAFVILFIACINYINLVTARGTRRSKEIGIRKVVGAQKKQLIRQFLGESIFLSLLSFFAAFLLVILLFPAFRAFIGRDIEIHLFEDKKIGTFFGGFSLLAIFISCLGLFGLASFTVENRTKEVGIRKVLGASLPGIFLLLTREFTKWVALANLIAWPLAYYFMNKWLQNFAYRSNLDVWLFVISGLTALCIAVLTVSIQSLKAATADPIESLRYE